MKRLTAELNMAESAQQAQDMDIQRLANELQVPLNPRKALAAGDLFEPIANHLFRK